MKNTRIANELHCGNITRKKIINGIIRHIQDDYQKISLLCNHNFENISFNIIIFYTGLYNF